ncbi:MAG: DUF4157 domain-containing protein [Ferruginibacter sp.]
MKEHSITVRESSWLAKIAAAKLRSGSVAIVMGNTIHLHNASKKDFLQNHRWLKHELCHVRQFQQHGFVPFIIKYLWESIKKGYYNNRFEVEARAAEEL